MIVRINNKQYDYFSNLQVTRRYDALCSEFSFDIYFNPENPDHRAITKPFSYHTVTIEHEGKLILTGTMFNAGFTKSTTAELVPINGCSITGILEDCEIPKKAYPLQSNGLSLKSIAEKIIKPFNIKLVVDDSIASKAGANYNTLKASDTQSVKQYLCELAAQKNIIVTHNEKGNLVLTQVKAGSKPIYYFNDSTPDTILVKADLQINAQAMHSIITLHKQASKNSPNAASDNVSNPYAEHVYRPKVLRQSSGSEVDTKLAARQKLSEELKEAVKLNILLNGWELDGNLIQPNTIISMSAPSMHLYNKTDFFVEQVVYKENAEVKTAELTCYLPEVYNGNTPKNIFA